MRCKNLSLTPFQIHVLLGLSDCDGDGQVPYFEFAKTVKEFVDSHYRFEINVEKQIIQEKKTQQIRTSHPQSKQLDQMELFRTFKKYDRNMNGTLDFSEYTQCLAECPGLDLTKHEIITCALCADMNQDGVIDFEEFMKHFSEFLNMIEYNKSLQESYDLMKRQ